ncbi:MAG: phosphotransferase family protein, partial [Anaerolineales bacterium]|nr:phosphotransferase family protein [Anaerolineales bacterium]
IPAAPRRMSEALVDALVAFHAVDYTALGLADLGKPEGFLERQIEGWHRRWHAAKTDDLEDMDAVYRWLGEHVPGETAVSLVHNDYKLDNVMLAANDPGKIVAVFDWDMCTLGDPLNDLGALLT